MVKKTLVQVAGNDYEVQFPTVGQLQDIEAMKIALTNGRYVDMVVSGLKTHNFALDSADAIAYFSTLIPELRDDLKLKSWREADALLAKQLIKDYRVFMKWLKPLLDDLYHFDDDIEKSAEDGDQES